MDALPGERRRPVEMMHMHGPSFWLVMVMVIHSALVRSHQSTYEGSFGPVPRGAPRANIAPNCLCLLMRGRASRSGGAHPTSPHGAMPTSPSRARTHAQRE